MHYHVEIWTPEDPTGNEEEIMARLMGPSEEEGNGYWDWYQFGGRWSGAHDGYNPSDDIRNYELCDMCGGDGVRKDRFKDDPKWVESCRGCNCCHGTGVKRKWGNAPHAGDVMELSRVKDNLDCYTLIIDKEDGKTYHSETWNSRKKKFIPGEFNGNVKEFLKSIGITGGYLITGDYHC